MDANTIQSLSNTQLKKMLQFRTVALTVLKVGVGFGLFATAMRFKVDGIIAWETGIVCVIAYLASIPVYYEAKRIKNTLSERSTSLGLLLPFIVSTSCLGGAWKIFGQFFHFHFTLDKKKGCIEKS